MYTNSWTRSILFRKFRRALLTLTHSQIKVHNIVIKIVIPPILVQNVYVMYIKISYKFHRIPDTQSRVITKVYDFLGQSSYVCFILRLFFNETNSVALKRTVCFKVSLVTKYLLLRRFQNRLHNGYRFSGINPSTRKKLLHSKIILLFLHLFPIFSLQRSTHLGETEFFKELRFLEEYKVCWVL